MKRPESKIGLAIGLMIIAAFFNALMAATAKFATGVTSTDMMLFWRNLICWFLLFPWLLWGKPHYPLARKLHTTEWKMHFIRGLCGLGSVFLYFYSLKSLTLTDATLLFNTMPIFVPIVGYLWKGFRIPHQIWAGFIIAFLGVMLVMKPTSQIFQWASLLALGSGIIGAVATMAIRLSHYTEPTYRTLFYYFTLAGLITGIYSLFNFSANWGHLDTHEILLLLLIGLFGMGYQVFLTLAAKYGPVRLTSSFIYLSVVFSMFLDYYLWNEELTWVHMTGFILITSGACLVAWLYPRETITNR